MTHLLMKTDTSTPNPAFLPRRILVARKKCKLSQAALSKRLGFKGRKTLAAIEAGKRSVSPDELVAIAEVTGQNLDFFTDPYRLVDEGKFSFRVRV